MSKKTGTENSEFEKQYALLNTSQQKAVDTIEGPVMVIAGPGTGKTQILTLRIANILLQTDTQPENILALTFTDSGAKTMRQRLRSYIGSRAYKVPIHTFHSFAESVVQRYPDAYNRIIGGRAARDLEKIELIETILQDNHITLLRPLGNPTYYTSHILSTISTLKREYITQDQLATIIATQEKELTFLEKVHQNGPHKGKIRGEYAAKEKSIAKSKELLYVYRQYESALTESHLYDFDDMIIDTIQALETNQDMLLDMQETYQYLLADEHQDVNGSQNKILDLLSSYHDHPNIFVVGDEKQAIYRFQGASLENFLYFQDKHTNTTVIELTENYRSGQTVLDAAHSLISTEEGPAAKLRIPLHAAKEKNAKIEDRQFAHQAVEDQWVTSQVAQLIDSGVSPKEIAVIVRTNREVEQFALLLRKHNVRVHASADGDILAHPITHTIQTLVEAVIEEGSEQALFAVLHGAYWGIKNSDLFKVFSARRFDTSLWDIVNNEETLRTIGISDTSVLLHVAEVLKKAQEMMSTEAPQRVLEYLLRESGFLEQVVISDPLEGVRVVRRLYDEIEFLVTQNNLADLRQVSDFFKKSIEHRLSITAPFIATDTDSVCVTTAHKAKGLEFTAVFIPHLYDSAWGSTTQRTYFDIPLTKQLDASIFDKEDDQRRLLYVALTRARQSIYLSASDTNHEGKELIRSRFFEDIDEKYVSQCDTKQFEEAYNPVSSLDHAYDSSKIETSFAKEVLIERGISATGLNNYLKSPWNYFYRNVLRIPETQAPHMQYGSVVHAVLEKAAKQYARNQKLPSATMIKEWINQALAKMPLSKEEYVRLHQKALEELIVYIEHAHTSWSFNLKTEHTFKVMLETGLSDIPEVMLVGKLDQLDLDEEGNVRRVIDYKTGKPKTRNAIEGKTKASDGDYKRQLVFYALLLELYDDERYRCRKGVLSFTQPDHKGVIHEEAFDITDDEIHALKNQIIEVVQEIVSGTFLNHPCDPNDSPYCHLALHLHKK